MSSALTSLLAFAAIVALIPLALWLLKRTPIGGGAAHGVMRTVAMLPISANQRLLTVEVGLGDDRKWLVLGVTSAGIQTLHTMAPQALPDAPSATRPFAQLLARHLPGKNGADVH
ncbi:MAG TPA: flagellar biosynthetic protein FliO [Burkholderiaceae bacterium]|nr:flagellar biosynthetic protein FliO [Burkholderiaceae bacterium]